MPHTKALSAVVAVVLLLMMTVGAAGMAYVFISGLQQSGQESTQGQLSTIQEAISSCMTVDSVYSNKVYLRNCGDGIIDNASLKVYMDDEPISLSMFPSKISKGEVGTVSLYGIWDLAPYTTHKLKIQNDATSTTKRVTAEPRKEDLVGGWDFDDGSGTSARDWSGNGNGGTLTNMESSDWVSGKFGGALQFDGVNEYVDVGNGASLKVSLPITFSLWINLPTNIDGSWKHLISSTVWGGNPGYDTMIHSNQQLIMTVNGIETTSPRPNFGMATATWHHIVYKVSSSTSEMYIDGALRQTWTGTWSLSGSTHNTWIGYSPAGSYNYFWGTMDDVRIYNKALTPDELVNLKAA